ncbi:uncharacterized protein LOC135088136 [Ostrinia nubilalis]|uniref:uncharacterized protein LOC135088136 n=2 Tax=Ostrinia TaxID=29056 RepID=UPI003082553D
MTTQPGRSSAPCCPGNGLTCHAHSGAAPGTHLHALTPRSLASGSHLTSNLIECAIESNQTNNAVDGGGELAASECVPGIRQQSGWLHRKRSVQAADTSRPGPGPADVSAPGPAAGQDGPRGSAARAVRPAARCPLRRTRRHQPATPAPRLRSPHPATAAHSPDLTSHRQTPAATHKMVRRYERMSGRQSWSEEDMAKAVAAVVSGKMGYKLAARTFHIPRSTLQRRASKVRYQQPDDPKPLMGHYRRVFTDSQEKDLVGYIKSMEKYFMGVSRRDIRELAFQYAEDNQLNHPFDVNSRMAGEDWVRNFLKRNPELLDKPDKDSELEPVNFDQFYHFMVQFS